MSRLPTDAAVAEPPAPTSHVNTNHNDSLEAQALIRRCAEPRPAGDMVKFAIARISRKLKWPPSRTRDLWYGAARRVDAAEMDRLRQEADKIGKAHTVARMRILQAKMMASPSPLSREVADGVGAAVCKLGIDQN